MTQSAAKRESNPENLLKEILKKLDTFEIKIDEGIYPPEESINQKFIDEVEDRKDRVAAGEYRRYKKMDDFLAEII